MTKLDKFMCDFCSGKFDGTPASEHTVDGESVDLCYQCSENFSRLRWDENHDDPNGHWQWKMVPFPRSVSGEETWRTWKKTKEGYHGLAEWNFFDWVLFSFYRDYVANTQYEGEDSEQKAREKLDEMRSAARSEARSDDDFEPR